MLALRLGPLNLSEEEPWEQLRGMQTLASRAIQLWWRTIIIRLQPGNDNKGQQHPITSQDMSAFMPLATDDANGLSPSVTRCY